MITFGGFIWGVLMMAVGLAMVIRTDFFLRILGDISELFGMLGLRWLSWKILGVLFIALGFMISFDILGAFFRLTIGRLFSFGGFGGL